MDKYLEMARTDLGAALFAVCRGRVSEGMDFPDELARCVMIVGIPYPPLKDRKVELKKVYLNTKFSNPALPPPKLSSEQWYSQQAVRAVNQAIGRVIRHINDYGCIIFLDERYGKPCMINQISKWVSSNLKVYDKLSPAFIQVRDFFNNKKC